MFDMINVITNKLGETKFIINTVKSALLGVIMLTMFSSTRSNYMQISNTNFNSC